MTYGILNVAPISRAFVLAIDWGPVSCRLGIIFS